MHQLFCHSKEWEKSLLGLKELALLSLAKREKKEEGDRRALPKGGGDDAEVACVVILRYS